MNDYEDYDALGLADLVRRREVSPSELLDRALGLAGRRNGSLNAVVWADPERAGRAIADGLPQGPFHGVPFLVKDISASVAGFPSTSGSRLFAGTVADADSELVRRHKAAGFVIFGMTTTPELGMNPTSEAALYGPPTRNPWDLGRSAGGSSGGAAAAVAGGILPLAHASDGAGSIRTPASSCGLFGLKPTRGRNPMGPKTGEGWGGLVVSHAVSRTVRDSAALLDATHGGDPGAPYAAPDPGGSFLEAAMRPPSGLRVGLVDAMPDGSPVHRDCLAALHEAAGLCAELGHHVEPARYPDVDYEALFQAHCLVIAAGSAASIDAETARRGRPLRDGEVESSTLDAVEFARRHDAVDYGKAVAAFHAVGRRMAVLLQRVDVLLTPTLAEPPAELGRFPTSLPFLELRRKIAAYAGFLPTANYTGQPAMTVPLHWNADGLPIGVQVLGPFGGERSLFALAGQLEMARPWIHRKPATFATSP